MSRRRRRRSRHRRERSPASPLTVHDNPDRSTAPEPALSVEEEVWQSLAPDLWQVPALHAALSAHDWEQCLALLETSDAGSGRNALISWVHTMRGERQLAIEPATAAYERRPGWATAQLLMSALEGEGGFVETDEATRSRIRELERQVLVDPECPRPNREVCARRYMEHAPGWTADLVSVLEAALACEPDSAILRAYVARARRVALQDVEGARRHLDAIPLASMTWAPLALLMSEEWDRVNEPEKALAWAETLTPAEGHEAGLLLYRGDLAYRAGNLPSCESARTALEATHTEEAGIASSLLRVALATRVGWDESAAETAEQLGALMNSDDWTLPYCCAQDLVTGGRTWGTAPPGWDLVRDLAVTLTENAERFPMRDRARSYWCYRRSVEEEPEHQAEWFDEAWRLHPTGDLAGKYANDCVYAERIDQALWWLMVSLALSERPNLPDFLEAWRRRLEIWWPDKLTDAAAAMQAVFRCGDAALGHAARLVITRVVTLSGYKTRGDLFVPVLREMAARYAEDPLVWFGLGYLLHDDPTARSEAIDANQRAAALDPGSHALWNLAVLLEGEDDQAAVVALEQLAEAWPDDAEIATFLQRLRHDAAARAEARRQQEEFLRSAPGRWSQLKQPQVQLLAVARSLPGAASREQLIRTSGMDEAWVDRHIKALVTRGMLVEEGEGWCLNPYVQHLVDRDLTHSVATRVIRIDDSLAFKPIFNSRREHDLYVEVLSLFPNMLVFPNMALQAIFQYERMKPQLDATAFKYYLMASVDLCVVSSATYFPVVAFELDSVFHDDAPQIARDERKDAIFRLGGVPLLRLRPHGSPTRECLRQAVIEAIRSLGNELRATHKSLYASVGEIDFEQFGGGALALPQGATDGVP